jgi:phosphoglycerate dehydrogenase-like enzyme
MITGRHFRSMKKGATFINSARGAVVRQEEMIAALKERPDLTAVLDVVHPEPPPLDDEVAQMPNIVLTPHIAGSMSGECRRLGRYVVNEVERYVAGQPPQWPITREAAEKLA